MGAQEASGRPGNTFNRGYSLRFGFCESLREICHLYIFSIKMSSDSTGSVLSHYLWRKTVLARQNLIVVNKFPSLLTSVWDCIDYSVQCFCIWGFHGLKLSNTFCYWMSWLSWRLFSMLSRVLRRWYCSPDLRRKLDS